MPAASKDTATDEEFPDETEQDSQEIPPPPVSQQVWRHADLTENMQAAILACAISGPDQFREFWEHGGHLFGFTGSELFFVAKSLLAGGRTLSLTAIHEKCRSKIERASKDDDERDEKWETLADFVALIEEVDPAKEKPYVNEHLESWLRRCRHDTALNAYAHAAAEARDQKEIVLRRVELIRALKDIDRPLGVASGQYFTICTMEEIMNDDGKPPEWVVDNLMPAVGVATVSGRGKDGKSWAALDLCLSVAAAADWLGFQTRRGKACYVNFELGKKTLARRLKHIAGVKHIELEPLKDKFLPLTIDTGGLVSAALEQKLEIVFTNLVLEQVRRGLEKAAMRDPAIIVLDSFYNLTGQLNENDAGDVGMVYHLVRKLANDLGCLVVIIHHFAKGSPGEKLQGDRAAGSRVHRQEPNTYIELAPHKVDGALVFSADLRDYPPIPKFCLRFEFPLFKVAPELDAEDLKRPPKRGTKELEFDPKAILAVLQDGPLSTSEWLAATVEEIGASASTFYRAKRMLKSTGKVEENDGKWLLSQSSDSSPRKHGKNP